MADTFYAFADHNLHKYLRQWDNRILDEIAVEPAATILATDEATVVDEMVNRYQLPLPVLDFSHPQIQERIEIVPASKMQMTRFYKPAETYRVKIKQLRFPYQGDPALLRFCPSRYYEISYECTFEDGFLCHDIWDVYGSDTNRLKSEVENHIHFMRSNFKNLQAEIINYNLEDLPRHVKACFHNRKIDLEKTYDLLKSINPEAGKDSLQSKAMTADRDIKVQMKPETPHNRPGTLFICHASADKPFVEKLIDELLKRNISVWYDTEKIKVGDSIVEKINEGLESSSIVIAVMSKSAVISPWVRRELDSSLMRKLKDGGIRILPLLIEDCKIPQLLEDIKYADFRSEFETGMIDLLKSITG